MNHFKAIAWDVDGLIFNSDELYFSLLKDELIRHEIDLSEEYYGKNGLDDSLHTLGLSADITREIKKNINNFYYSDRILERLKFKPKFPSTLKALSSNFRFVIATGEKETQVEKYLQHFGIQDMFEFIAHGQLVPGRKSNPDYFKILLKALDIERQDLLFVGDSQSDSHVASFGIETWILPSKFTRHATFHSGAKIIQASDLLKTKQTP